MSHIPFPAADWRPRQSDHPLSLNFTFLKISYCQNIFILILSPQKWLFKENVYIPTPCIEPTPYTWITLIHHLTWTRFTREYLNPIVCLLFEFFCIVFSFQLIPGVLSLRHTNTFKLYDKDYTDTFTSNFTIILVFPCIIRHLLLDLNLFWFQISL